ncbi:MAG: S41 family peptidase, partial [Bacteroidota bacterium]
KSNRQFEFLHPAYPHLTAIDGVPIDEFLQRSNLENRKAPAPAWAYEALRQLRFLEECFNSLDMPMGETVEFQFSGVAGDTIWAMSPGEKRLPAWTEKMDAFSHEDEELNDSLVFPLYFQKEENGIARIYLPQMVREKKAPLFYQYLRSFMETEVANSEALIIDVRSNGGGRRELILALAEYLVHPDSIHVVNIAQQRGERPLSGSYQRDLHRRYLYNLDAFDQRERAAIKVFEETFVPVYELDTTRFSERHYTILNGAKLRPEIYLDLPVYVLINERSFSAASILAAIFKGLPNVTLVGVNTDGSSGNSEVNYLTHSGIRVRISTMVSFQKDGQLLDGYGTAPDLEIERDLRQIFWIEDTQLEVLIESIKGSK